jgi:hypothetical protein
VRPVRGRLVAEPGGDEQPADLVPIEGGGVRFVVQPRPVHVRGGKVGVVRHGFVDDHAEDHCVSLCGYGAISWLAQQLGVKVPAGVDGTKPGYAVYTWNSIGAPCPYDLSRLDRARSNSSPVRIFGRLALLVQLAAAIRASMSARV